MRLLLVALLMVGGCADAPAPRGRDAVLIDAATVVPDLVVDMRYAGSDNFVGRPIDGYEAPVCLLTREAAEALRKARYLLSPMGLGLKVFDCYRPARAVADFVAWAKDPADQKRKTEHYPDVDKSRLFELGYIAEKSGHSRGSTLDLTLVGLGGAEELDMGGRYDLFDTSSWPSATTVSEQAQKNRRLLQTTMIAAGFRPLREEWWHFTLNGEPYPETYFDFVVAR